MRILLKIFMFLLFTSILGRPAQKCNNLDSESINDCNGIKQISQEYINCQNTVQKGDGSFKGDVHSSCSTTELNNYPTVKTTSEIRKDIKSDRSAEPKNNNLNSDFAQKVVTDLTPIMTTSTVANLNYSEECSTSNQKLGEITTDETFDNNTHCCGIDANSGNRIYGGTETAIDEYPWLAMLEYEGPLLCGGTLISSFYVLTAAHCLIGDSMKPRDVKSVRLGEYNTNNDGVDCIETDDDGIDCTDGAVSITISNLIVHPDYNNHNPNILRANDIGLVRLSKSSPYSDFIRPICLPSSDITEVAISSDYRFHVAGWGAVNDYQQRSDVKLQVELPITDQKVCEKLYSINGKPMIWEKQFCAGSEKNKDTCRGDSGGPLIYSDNEKHEIVGITSFGILKCGSQGRPSVYTKVFKYVPWILANMKSAIKSPK